MKASSCSASLSSVSYLSSAVPFRPKGMLCDAVWFCGGRIGASVAAHGGIEKVVYYGRQHIGKPDFFLSSFRSAYPKVFRPYLLVGEQAYVLELNRTSFYPGGYSSFFAIPEKGIEVEHRLVLGNDVLLQTVRVLKNKLSLPLRLRVAWHAYTGVSIESRKWEPWREGKNLFSTCVTDTDHENKERPTSDTYIGFTADRDFSTRAYFSKRRFFETVPFKKGAVTAAVFFAPDRKSFLKRASQLRASASLESNAELSKWLRRTGEVPTLSLASPSVESFFRMTPLVNEGLMPRDLPGGMRAAAGHYWVWGWDTMVHIEAHLASGQTKFVRDVLDLYHRTANPEKGIGHQFTTEMKLRIPQAPSAQGLYIYALYQYVAYTGDMRTFRKHYPFVKFLIGLCAKSLAKEGLFEGPALFPDHPRFAGHTGHDISVFNNAIFYQAARAMEQLSGWANDLEMQTQVRRMWQKLGDSFDHYFWDDKQGYWVDSLDSRTLAPRRSYPSHAITPFSPFARELYQHRVTKAAKFISTNLVYNGGIRMYPLWDSSFNGDGNQLGQHYPAGTDPFFLKVCSLAEREDLLEKWLNWVEQFWNQNTIPEGTTCEAENEGPNYPDLPGGKQPFSAKAWYMGIVQSILGVSFDAGGITAETGLAREVEAERIFHANKLWRIRSHGSGKYIDRLVIDGKTVRGTSKLPADLVGESTPRLEIFRTKNAPSSPHILSADGARITKLQLRKNGFSLFLSAPATVVVHYASPKKPKVAWRGKNVATVYDAKMRTGKFTLDLKPSSTHMAGILIVVI